MRNLCYFSKIQFGWTFFWSFPFLNGDIHYRICLWNWCCLLKKNSSFFYYWIHCCWHLCSIYCYAASHEKRNYVNHVIEDTHSDGVKAPCFNYWLSAGPKRQKMHSLKMGYTFLKGATPFGWMLSDTCIYPTCLPIDASINLTSVYLSMEI